MKATWLFQVFHNNKFAFYCVYVQICLLQNDISGPFTFLKNIVFIKTFVACLLFIIDLSWYISTDIISALERLPWRWNTISFLLMLKVISSVAIVPGTNIMNMKVYGFLNDMFYKNIIRGRPFSYDTVLNTHLCHRALIISVVYWRAHFINSYRNLQI